MNLNLFKSGDSSALLSRRNWTIGALKRTIIRPTNPGFRVLLSVTVVLMLSMSAQPAWSVVDPVINEFVFNHTGTDQYEFVEVYGAPSALYEGLFILEIEGDGTGAGIVDGVFQVGTTDGAGLWTTAFMNNILENGTVTLLLVWEFTGSQGDDLDTDNDGGLDSTPWLDIVDDVAVHDGGASDHTYASVTLDLGYDGVPYTPGGASRIPNGVDTDSVTDWVRNDFDGEGLPGYVGTPAPGEAINTPGAENQLVEPAGDPIINEFVADHTGLDDHEYVEIFGDPEADYSRFRILEIEGDGTYSGLVDGIFGLGTTDADGFWWTGFMDSELENGTMTLLLVENFTGYMGQDLDPDNDGDMDVTPWGRLVDDVATVNGGTSDWAYSSVTLMPDFDGNSYQPGGASRIPNGTDTDSVADWMRNDYEGYGLPGFPGTEDPGEAINTPGATNSPVVDDTPPVITVDLNRTVLWPPNHKMVDIHATVTVTDNADPFPTFALVSVISTEPPNDKGDGNTDMDIQRLGDADPDLDFQLRAERQGRGNGREYLITYMATDASGNTTTMTVAVTVPHDHSGWAMASSGFTADGTALDNSSDRFAIVLPSRPETIEEDEHGRRIVVEGYDATEIDAHYVYIGNQKNALRPVDSQELDANADGMPDLALFYSVTDAMILQSSIAEGSVGEERIALNESRLGPAASGATLGLHYESPDGGNYLVSDIFGLGRPIELAEAGSSATPSKVVNDARGEIEPAPLTSIYPNPFRSATTVSFELPTWGNVKVQVFDVRGMLVRTLKNEALGPGRHHVDWDGRDGKGQEVACGIYIVRLEAGGRLATRKAIMLK